MNDFLNIVYNALDEKLGVDIKVIDISEISVLAD
jgi:ribosomal silencing factor RsfS